MRSSRGPVVPAQFGREKFESTVGPVTVNHSGQIPSVTISFNLASGDLSRHSGEEGGAGSGGVGSYPDDRGIVFRDRGGIHEHPA